MERVGLTPEDIKAKNIAFYEDMISNREKYIKRMKRRDGAIKRYFKLSILILFFSESSFPNIVSRIPIDNEAVQRIKHKS